MYKRTFQYLLLIVCSIFLLAACTNEKKESDPATPPSKVDEKDDGQAVDAEEEDQADESTTSDNQAELPAPIEVNEELLVDGVTLKVEKSPFMKNILLLIFMPIIPRAMRFI